MANRIGASAAHAIELSRRSPNAAPANSRSRYDYTAASATPMAKGFNQSDRLAKPLARWLQCPYSPELLKRTRNTRPQQSLSAVRRRRNLRNAFTCQQNPSGKHILLVDDVFTTGSTIGEVSRLLIAQGAKSIQVVCLCRTL